MCIDTSLLPFIGTLIAVTSAGAIALFVYRKNRKQNYYIGLVKLFGDHNWNLVGHKLSDGLPITGAESNIVIVCQQHLNLLFYAWLHLETIEADGSLGGWRRWASAIVEGAKLPENDQHRQAYFDILSHGDLYPQAFRDWLGQSLGLCVEAFAARAVPRTATE